METPTVLSGKQVDFFIEHGYLKLKQCIPRDTVQKRVRETFRPGGCLEDIYSRTVQDNLPCDDRQFDLEDSTKWSGRRRFDVDTGHFVSIKELSPMLWGALSELAGGEANLHTTHMARKWILNTRYDEKVDSSLSPENYEKIRGAYWHADTISKQSTLKGRLDAFSLLVLWSDVEAGGGGTLYSSQSVRKLLERYNQYPDGIDTTTHEGLRHVMGSCDSFLEVTGDAGDVVILHALGLHAFNECKTKKRVRILENLGVALKTPLNYSPEKLHPTPVEKCVASKITAFPVLLKQLNDQNNFLNSLNNAIDYLITRHPDYFRVFRDKWYETTPTSEKEKVYRIDYELMTHWAKLTASRVRGQNVISQIKSAIHLVHSSLISQRQVRIEFSPMQEALRSTHNDFMMTGCCRALRGITNCEGVNHLLWLVLRENFPETVLWDLLDTTTGRGVHVVVKVVTPEGWAIADAWTDEGLYYVPEFHPGTPLEGVSPISDLYPKNEPEDVQFYPEHTFWNGHHVLATLPFNNSHNNYLQENEYAEYFSKESIFSQLTSLEKTGSDSPWQTYLRTRARHWFEAIETPESLYQELLENDYWAGEFRQVIQRYGGLKEPVKDLRGRGQDQEPLLEAISATQQAIAHLLEDNAASNISDKLPNKFLQKLRKRLTRFAYWGDILLEATPPRGRKQTLNKLQGRWKHLRELIEGLHQLESERLKLVDKILNLPSDKTLVSELEGKHPGITLGNRVSLLQHKQQIVLAEYDAVSRRKHAIDLTQKEEATRRWAQETIRIADLQIAGGKKGGRRGLELAIKEAEAILAGDPLSRQASDSTPVTSYREHIPGKE